MITADIESWVVVTPNDDTDLANSNEGRSLKGLHIGGSVSAAFSGSITCLDRDGTEAVFWVEQGDWLSIQPKRIKATGTTSGLVILALY